MPNKTILSLNNVVKSFGDFTAVKGISLEINEGEFFTIVGPSGSGKSTLIRLLVGMEELSSGEIWLRDERIDQKPANLRPTCMVFQSLALFPHMTVGQNIEFPLKLKNVLPDEREKRAFDLLNLLRLPQNYYSKRISQCSGGEQQRVALARALAFDPEILFFDEPLSSLDYRLRNSLEEAMVMSDRIAIMKSGQFEQIANADEIYEKPKSSFVAEFMGEVNLFEINSNQSNNLIGRGLEINLSKTKITKISLKSNQKATLMVRPEYVKFLDKSSKADFIVRGILMAEFALGSRTHYEVETSNGQIVTVEKLREDRFKGKSGASVTLGFDLENVHTIKVSNGKS